jgi:hypothetical protein
VPTSWNLTSNCSAEFESLRNENSSAFLELDEPLLVRGSPDVALIAVFMFEFFGVITTDFNRLKIVSKLHLLIEDLLIRVVSSEELGL